MIWKCVDFTCGDVFADWQVAKVSAGNEWDGAIARIYNLSADGLKVKILHGKTELTGILMNKKQESERN